ncbi:protein phosphatase CheZ [Enterobacterales bacterium CwR94]|nr:protein phosphatase CheZ [Enterobacterales bacterium CwR94]
METPQANEAADSLSATFFRLGQLARELHDDVARLGLGQAMQGVAEAIPDTRQRLEYVAGKTAQAASQVLSSVEMVRPLQRVLGEQAETLTSRWDTWFVGPLEMDEARQLVRDTRTFLRDTPALSTLTQEQLTAIMLAQDFQDLTGQVMQQMLAMIEKVERELVHILRDTLCVPEAARLLKTEGLKNGPQIDPTAADVVASQDQVDDLLESLGF